MERKVVPLTNPRAREYAAKLVATAPDGWVARITPPSRTGAQNAGTHLLYEIIAQTLPEDDAAGWKRYCKLHHGVPILRAENPEFREAYDAAIKPLPYEAKLAIMKYFPVTSLMDKGQIGRYIDAMREYFEPLGVILELDGVAA